MPPQDPAFIRADYSTRDATSSRSPPMSTDLQCLFRRPLISFIDGHKLKAHWVCEKMQMVVHFVIMSHVTVQNVIAETQNHSQLPLVLPLDVCRLVSLHFYYETTLCADLCLGEIFQVRHGLRPFELSAAVIAPTTPGPINVAMKRGKSDFLQW